MKVANTLIPLSLASQFTTAAPINHFTPVNINTTQVDTHKELDMRSNEGLHSISWNGTAKFDHEYECRTDDQCGPFGHCALKKPTEEAPEPVTICHCEDGYVNEPFPGKETTPNEVCSYKQLPRTTQLLVSWLAGFSGADYYTSAVGNAHHNAVGAVKSTLFAMFGTAGLAVGALAGNPRTGALTGLMYGAGGQVLWHLVDAIRTSLPPRTVTSFRDGNGVPFH